MRRRVGPSRRVHPLHRQPLRPTPRRASRSLGEGADLQLRQTLALTKNFLRRANSAASGAVFARTPWALPLTLPWTLTLPLTLFLPWTLALPVASAVPASLNSRRHSSRAPSNPSHPRLWCRIPAPLPGGRAMKARALSLALLVLVCVSASEQRAHSNRGRRPAQHTNSTSRFRPRKAPRRSMAACC